MGIDRGGLVDHEALQHLTGFDRMGDIARALERQGIRYLRGRAGRLFTTVDALNKAMGISPSEPDAPYSPDLAD